MVMSSSPDTGSLGHARLILSRNSMAMTWANELAITRVLVRSDANACGVGEHVSLVNVSLGINLQQLGKSGPFVAR